MKTLAKGVSGVDLGEPPFWQIGPLSGTGGECFAPCATSGKLGALPLAEGEGVRSTLLSHGDTLKGIRGVTCRIVTQNNVKS